MSKIKPPQNRSQHPLNTPQDGNSVHSEETISSVVFAVVLLIAVIVGMSSWLGGGIPNLKTRISHLADTLAGGIGLAVGKVSVFGVEPSSDLEQAIRAVARIEPGENMWRARPHRIKADIVGLGQVQNVRVARYWPNQIVIFAEPIEPIAQWQHNHENYWVDAKGQQFKYSDTLSPIATHPTILFTGAEAAPHIPEFLKYVDTEALNLVEAHWYNRRRWIVKTQQNVRIHLPVSLTTVNARQLLEELPLLLKRPILRSSARLDLRVPGRLIIQDWANYTKLQNKSEGVSHG